MTEPKKLRMIPGEMAPPFDVPKVEGEAPKKAPRKRAPRKKAPPKPRAD